MSLTYLLYTFKFALTNDKRKKKYQILLYPKIPVKKISIPMMINIAPPINEAYFDNLVPNFLPIYTPAIQIIVVIKATNDTTIIAS